ncbi:hypothetical protein [Faecalibacterium langellae]|uniref:hypothetical protein n=2 Tax=Faecalibacterium TaxID=216851 RepID=UPI001FA87242|nr:hypothetical protein [Faecalibacterium prausnitzii]
MAKTLGSKLDGLVPTCCAMLPTWVFTSSNKPERLDMIAAVSSDLIQSEIALRTVSTQCHHPSRKMIDQGLEQVEQKDNVRQKLHKNRLPFK